MDDPDEPECLGLETLAWLENYLALSLCSSKCGTSKRYMGLGESAGGLRPGWWILREDPHPHLHSNTC